MVARRRRRRSSRDKPTRFTGESSDSAAAAASTPEAAAAAAPGEEEEQVAGDVAPFSDFTATGNDDGDVVVIVFCFELFSFDDDNDAVVKTPLS